MTVLVLRPKDKVFRTAEALKRANIQGESVALMETRALPALPSVPGSSKGSIVIVTSTVAAHIAAGHYADLKTRASWISIGKSTADVLDEYGISSQYPRLSTSEGVLEMATLQRANEQRGANRLVFIFKGMGGRDKLATELAQRGFTPISLEVYERVPLPEPFSSGPWEQDSIRIMVATSGEQVELAFAIYPAQWLTSLTWVLVSERTADIARKFGVQRLAVSNGASDNAIMTTLNLLMEQ